MDHQLPQSHRLPHAHQLEQDNRLTDHTYVHIDPHLNKLYQKIYDSKKNIELANNLLEQIKQERSNPQIKKLLSWIATERKLQKLLSQEIMIHKAKLNLLSSHESVGTMLRIEGQIIEGRPQHQDQQEQSVYQEQVSYYENETVDCQPGSQLVFSFGDESPGDERDERIENGDRIEDEGVGYFINPYAEGQPFRDFRHY